MKSKQLANVLIKILGLSILAHGIPSILSGLVSIFRAPQSFGVNPWYYIVATGATLAIGIYLILKSRDVAEYLFKGYDE